MLVFLYRTNQMRFSHISQLAMWNMEAGIPHPIP